MTKKEVIEVYEETRRLIEEVRDKVEKALIIDMEKALAEMQDEYLKQMNEFNELLKVSNETNQMLMDAMPKVLGPEGATLCRLAERVIPGDKVVLLRYSPSTKKVYLSIVPDENGKYVKLVEFSDITRSAIELANKMVDDEGRLSKVLSDKIEN